MRERKDFMRPSGKRNSNLIIIATEGEITEKAYFEGLLSMDGFPTTSVHVEVLNSVRGESSPNHVITRLDGFKKEYKLSEDDQLWFVLDKDRWPNKNLAEVARLSAQKGFNMALSNPCFELWLLLHWIEPSNCEYKYLSKLWNNPKVTSSRNFLDNELRIVAGGYRKNKPDFRKYYRQVWKAMEGGFWLDADSSGRWPDYLASRVFLLLLHVLNGVSEEVKR